MEKLINQDDRFFVAGHRGMAGSGICRALQRSGYETLLTASRDELDLLDLQAVERWFADNKPTVVVLAAAKVGGIMQTIRIQLISCWRI
jgi:GDP-L-fucose synthase